MADPITAAEFKEHCEIIAAETRHDAKLVTFLAAGIAYAESHTGLSITETVKIYTLDTFPDIIALPGAPITAIQEINYTDDDGNSQILSPAVYRQDVNLIKLVEGESWPSGTAVNIVYKLGFGGDVPRDLKVACMMLGAGFFENREAEGAQTLNPSPAANHILQLYRMYY